MVKTTTLAKQIAPMPGVTEATCPARTSPTSVESMNTSIIDQRPMNSTTRYSRVRSRSRHAEPRWVAISITARLTSFSSGTATLATKTNSASGHIPASSSSCAPPRMVLGLPRSN